MSSNNQEYQVNKVRIVTSNDNNMQTYTDNVKVFLISDDRTKVKYFRITDNEKVQFSQDFKQLKWIPESSADGIATVRSLHYTIIIFFDDKNKLLNRFFQELQTSLTYESKRESTDLILSQPDPDLLKHLIDQLIQSISSGDSNEAESMAKQLADSHVNVQFNLINKDDHENTNTVKSVSNTGIRRSCDAVLQLSLRIECLSANDPIITSIVVRSGTTLRSLKNQIEKETGFKYTDQYWFAFKRYPIPDDYIFGSSIPLIPNKDKQTLVNNCIQSGDTLIMYIAQMSSSN